MSFLKRLFGGGGASDSQSPAESVPAKEIEHKGFTVAATPFKEEGQFQTCGVIRKEIDCQMKEHRFIRADRFTSLDDAVDMALRKGVLMIDEQGERLFK